MLLGAVAFAFVLGGWVAGTERTFDTEDWVAALDRMVAEGHCARVDVFLETIIAAGEPAAFLQKARLLANKSYTDRCGVPALSTEAGRRQVEHLIGYYDKEMSMDDIAVLSAPFGFEINMVFYDRWSVRRGWRDVVDFAGKHPARPDLVLQRAGTWLGCSNPQLFSSPKNRAAINRAVSFIAYGQRLPPATQLETWRTWCGNRLMALSRATESELPYDDRVLAIDAFEFGNRSIEIDAIRNGASQSQFRGGLHRGEWLGRLEGLAGHHRQVSAQLLLAELLYKGITFGGVKTRDRALLSAFWATIALDHGAPAQDMLARAQKDLSPEQRDQVTDVVACWYQYGVGPTATGTRVGMGWQGPGEPYGPYAWPSPHDAPWQEILNACDVERPGSWANKMSPQPEPEATDPTLSNLAPENVLIQVSTPQVSTPQVSAPQVSAPQVSAPQVSAQVTYASSDLEGLLAELDALLAAYPKHCKQSKGRPPNVSTECANRKSELHQKVEQIYLALLNNNESSETQI